MAEHPAFEVRDEVVAAIRASLPEFAQRNKIELSEQVMDNLAFWVAGVVPPFTYRQACWDSPADTPDEPFACACIGTCQRWHRVSA